MRQLWPSERNFGQVKEDLERFENFLARWGNFWPGDRSYGRLREVLARCKKF